MSIKTMSYPKEQSVDRPAGNFPIVGLLAILVGGLAFGVLAFSVATHGPLLAWDEPIIQALHFRATHDFWVDFNAMVFTGTLGRETAVLITIALGAIWLFTRHWRYLSMLLLGVVGGNVWFEVLSNWFGRHRPVFADPIHIIPNPGFPSGHSIAAVTLYSLLLYLVWPRLQSTGWRILAVVDTLAVMLLIGYSRLYMGDHYPTDVLAGYAFGLLWSGLVYTSLSLFIKKRTKARA
jgi:undecaprenyl-diphosphatase